MTTLISFDVLAKSTIDNVDAFGGSTVSAIVGVPTVSSGYAVSLPGHERKLQRYKGGVIARNFIAWYAEQKRAELAVPGRYLGAWIDEGDLYLDITEVHAEFAEAVRLGYERNQLAIYDLGRGEEISTQPGRRATVTDAQTRADKLANESGWVHAWIMTYGADVPTPFSVVGEAIAELGDDGELRLVK